VEPDQADRIGAWLDAVPRGALDDVDAAHVRRALAGEAGPATLAVEPHGTLVAFLTDAAGGRRRVLAFDRHGTLLTALRWSRQGALASAWSRLPDGSWIVVKPDAASPDRVDRLRHAPGAGESGVAMTTCEALDWARLDRIPTVAEPARLPPGAGTAVLGLIATLAADQGLQNIAYGGPYPGEQLFLSLLEAFRYRPAVADPLAAFSAGALMWTPAPPERRFEPEGVYVEVRGRVEKVVWRGRTYLRSDAQGVRRRTAYQIRETDASVRCSAWFLDSLLADHLALDHDGTLLRVLPAASDDPAVVALAPAAKTGLIAVVIAESAAPLAPWLRAVAGALALEWGSTGHDLIRLGPDRARISWSVRDALAARVAAATTPGARLMAGLAALREMALLLGDALRGRAQAALGAASPEVQRAALLTGATVATDPTLARELAEGAGTLVEETLRSSAR
jgi:hypothetical protein